MRSVLTVLAGLVSGGLTIYVLEWLGHRIAPPPEGLRLEDIDAIKAYVATAPPKVFLLLLAAWAGGAFVGGLVASFVAARARLRHALVVGGVQTAMATIQLAMVPHPLWVAVSGIALFVPFAWLGGRLFANVPDAAA
jgi:hypothetical protein